MTNHTPEPWIFGEDNDGWYISTENDEQHGHGLSEEDARRIVNCVNACKGLSNDDLSNGALFSAAGIELFGENNEIKILSAQLAAVATQRDELLTALKEIASTPNRCADIYEKLTCIATDAIAKCEEKP